MHKKSIGIMRKNPSINKKETQKINEIYIRY